MNTWRQRITPWLTPTPHEAVAIGVLLVGAVVLSLLVTNLRQPAPFVTPVTVEPLDTQTVTPQPQVRTEQITVHVSGAVASPGLATLENGARVNDVVVARGGLTADADVDRVNLAKPVHDGDHVHVPRVGEPALANDIPTEPSQDTPLNLNTADAAALTRLPGIGPAKADAILTYRNQNGPFTEIGQLTNVPGIGDATFQRLAPLITVR